MQTASQMDTSMSWEEFLSFVRNSDVKFEFENGQVFAMAGASLDHCAVVENLVIDIGSFLRGTPCRAFSSGALVRIHTETDNIGYYPDLVVACNRTNDWYIAEPKLIVEVWSLNTRRKDMTIKQRNYRLLETLQEYVLIDVDHRSAEVNKRLSTNQWLTTIYNTGLVKFDSLEFEISIDSIFQNVGAQP